MKFCLYILKASIAILIFSLCVYTTFFCFGKDGIDPIEIDTIGMLVYTVFGVLFSLFLIRRAGSMRAIWFGLGFIFYLLTWTFPTIFMTFYTLLMMGAG
jgi:hypothetical protein